MKTLKGNKGFTLIEIVVVLAVIAILGAVLTPMTLNYISDAKVRRAELDVKSIATAILALNNDTRSWPVRTNATGSSDDINTLIGDSDGEAPSGGAVIGDANTDSLDDHIKTNLANYPNSGKYQWRGYMLKLDADPWGNYYYVDVTGLRKSNLGTPASTAFAISAGPDETLNTGVDVGTATAASGDDIMFRIK